MGLLNQQADWVSGLSDNILFDKNDYKLRPESQQQIREMASRLAATGAETCPYGWPY
ncbi:putative outer membrane lipoprotein [Citrobacter koseri]|uniref:Putative outer membrane lipoprotein n=1 Tax=Citrobacter koseri TaxID=545 RepID=A0A2X2WNE5_CITKO|nr:putative outer membrane lipoprotein [Citrobacter koseri]